MVAAATMEAAGSNGLYISGAPRGGTYNHHTMKVEEPQELTPDILNRLEKAIILAKDDKILMAAYALHGIIEKHLQPVHHNILKEAEILKSLLKDNTTYIDESNHGGWTKQGERHGKHNFLVYYKQHKSTITGQQELSCRLETVVHSDLLVPILSVLNESELYTTWLPNWTVPKLKVVLSEKMRQTGRCSQVVNVETEVPWPLKTRQVILKAVACDNIDPYAEEVQDVEDYGCSTSEHLGKDGGRIIIRLQSLDCENNVEEELDIPPVKKGTVRMRVQGGFTIEKCHKDHPMLQSLLQYDLDASTKESNDASTKPSMEDMVLITFTFCVDPQLAVIPKSFINFFLRTAIGAFWNQFLNVAEAVKEGRRPAHSDAIKQKQELYDWIEERTTVMLQLKPSEC